MKSKVGVKEGRFVRCSIIPSGSHVNLGSAAFPPLQSQQNKDDSVGMLVDFHCCQCFTFCRTVVLLQNIEKLFFSLVN